MRNDTTNQLASIINSSPDITALHTKLGAFDITEEQFFFVHNSNVVQAYRVESTWYCKY